MQKKSASSGTAFHENQRGEVTVRDTAGTVKCAGGKPGQGYLAVLVGAVAVRDVSPTLTGNYGKQVDNSDTALGPNVVFPNARVRRLTPVECEKLQGFSPNYTAVPDARGKPSADGPRYKALGNSMAVPVMRWIGRAIDYAMIW